MDNSALARTELLIGREKIERLSKSHVIVFGLGGVGSYAAEALCRGGVGRLTLVDFDVIDVTNLNRQLQTTRATIGRSKAEVSRERCLSIMPDARVKALCERVDGTNVERLLAGDYDFAIDAIDMVTSKILLAEVCAKKKIPLIASMGMGNKLAPEQLKIADLSQTKICPLARVIRKELRRRGIVHLPVVYSEEEPIAVGGNTPGSTSFVPATAGLYLASYVIRSLCFGDQEVV